MAAMSKNVRPRSRVGSQRGLPGCALQSATRRWLSRGGLQLGAGIAYYALLAIAPLPAIAAASLEPASSGPRMTLLLLLGVLAIVLGLTGMAAQTSRSLHILGPVPRPVHRDRAHVTAVVRFAAVLGTASLMMMSLAPSAALALAATDINWHAGALALIDLLLCSILLTPAFAACLRWGANAVPSAQAQWLSAGCGALMFSLAKQWVAFCLVWASRGALPGAIATVALLVILGVFAAAQSILFAASLATVLSEAHELRAGMPQFVDTAPRIEQPLPIAATALRGKLATHKRITPLIGRRRKSSTDKTWAGSAVLLRFPDVRGVRKAPPL